MEKEEEKTENVGNMFGENTIKKKLNIFQKIKNFFKKLFA